MTWVEWNRCKRYNIFNYNEIEAIMISKYLLIFISICSLSFICEGRLDAGVDGRLGARVSSTNGRVEAGSSVTPCTFGHNFRQYNISDGIVDDQHLLKASVGYSQMQDSVLSPSQRFMMHFDRVGEDAVSPLDDDGNGIPDYIDSIGIILDHVWNVEIDSLGFQAPLNKDGERLTVYPVYFEDLDVVYGHTFVIEEISTIQGRAQYTSRMVLDNDYTNDDYTNKDLDAARVTAAHEFLHALQLSSGVWIEDGTLIDLFLLEMMATWVEDIVYDDVNRYYEYLPLFFHNFSNTSFDHDVGLYPYGNCLFIHMIAQKFGHRIVVDILETMQTVEGLAALMDVLGEYGTTSSIQLHEYGVWLSTTASSQWPSLFFEEGHLYPALSVQDQDMHFLGQEFAVECDVSAYACRILDVEVLNSRSFTGLIPIVLDRIWVGYVDEFEPIGSLVSGQSFTMYLEEDNHLRVILTNANSHHQVVPFVIAQDFAQESQEISVFPSPVMLGEHDTMMFANVAGAHAIHVFTADGWKVISVPVHEYDVNVRWDLKNEEGDLIPSGIYLYVIGKADGEAVGKFMVVQ